MYTNTQVAKTNSVTTARIVRSPQRPRFTLPLPFPSKLRSMPEVREPASSVCTELYKRYLNEVFGVPHTGTREDGSAGSTAPQFSSSPSGARRGVDDGADLVDGVDG